MVHVNHEGMLCVCLTTLTVLTVLVRVYAYCVTELHISNCIVFISRNGNEWKPLCSR